MKNWKGINRKKKAVLWCEIVAHNAHKTASLSAARVKPQDTVSLLVIHSCSAQDNTKLFLGSLAWTSYTCLFEYKWLFTVFPFFSSDIFMLIFTHVLIFTFQNSCCHVFPLPHPLLLLLAPDLCPFTLPRSKSWGAHRRHCVCSCSLGSWSKHL